MRNGKVETVEVLASYSKLQTIDVQGTFPVGSVLCRQPDVPVEHPEPFQSKAKSPSYELAESAERVASSFQVGVVMETNDERNQEMSKVVIIGDVIESAVRWPAAKAVAEAIRKKLAGRIVFAT